MSLNPFKRRTIAVVAASTARINDELPEDRLTALVLKSVIQGDMDLPGSILYNNLTGYTRQLTQFYNYAAASYHYGIPTTNISHNDYNAAAVAAVLDTLLSPETVTLVSSFLYEPTPLVWAMWWLYNNDGTYDFTDNTLVQSSTTYDVVGATVNNQKTEITVQLDNGGTPAIYATTITTMPAWDELYYFVEYREDATPAVYHIWAYQASLGTHATLDIDDTFIYDPIVPIVPIRLDDANINADKESEAYLTTVALMDRVKIPFDTLTDGVTKQFNDEGDLIDLPDLPLISDIFFLYGLSLYATEQIEMKALYVLFADLESQARTDEISYTAELGLSGPVSTNSFVINHETFDYELRYSYITITTIPGEIMEKGEYSIIYTPQGNTTHNRPTDIDDQTMINSYITIRYQTDLSEYQNMVIYGIWQNHEIKSVKGLKAHYSYLEAHTTGDELSDIQKNFIIPLTINTLNGLTLREVDALVPITAHIIAYASDSQKLKWYQSGVFGAFIKIFLLVVAIVLFVPSGGTSFEIFLGFLTLMAIKYAFEWVLKELLLHFEGDGAATAIVQVIAVVVLFWLMPGDFLEMAFPEQLIAAVSSTATVSTIASALDLDILEKERMAFEAEYDAADKLIRAAQDELKVDTLLDPSVILDVRRTSYETSQGFFARTLAQNPGVLVYDQLHEYVDINLNLEYIRV